MQCNESIVENPTEETENLPTEIDKIEDGYPEKIERTKNPVDLSKALKLRLYNNLSYGNIAQTLNCSKSSLWKALKPFENMINHPEAVSNYDNNRVQLISAAEMALLNKIVDKEALKSASVNNAAYAYQVLNNARRLEKGESTANIDHHHLTQKLSDLEAEEAKLMEELEEI